LKKTSIVAHACVLLIVAVAVESTAARTWRVDASGTGDAPTIQAAVDSSGPGDTILLAPGTYTGPGSKGIISPYHPLVITSESGPENTIIDLESDGWFFYYQWYYDASGSVISDITIRNSSQGAVLFSMTNGALIENVLFLNNKGPSIHTCCLSGATVRACEFRENHSSLGGAIHLENSQYFRFEECTFIGNVANRGGAAFADGVSYLRFIGCTFFGNSARERGGAIYTPSYTLISGCTLVDNEAPEGGAIYLAYTGYRTVETSIIAFNRAGTGGGIDCEGFFSNEAEIDRCLLFGNENGDLLCGTTGYNLFVDPQFCSDPLSPENLYLQSDSPAAPANNAFGERIGAWDVACGTISTVPTTWGRIKARFE
jgi:predicted outer membrane repeat protein